MSDSDQLQYQVRAFHELTHIIQTQKIPNSLLFYGNENTKREDAAFFFAKGCNCLEKMDIPCNNCKSCRKIDKKTHPDILTIDLEKEKKIISISQIRKMGLTIASKPNEARFRMVLILNAEKMNTQAQNALLKMLEEPPEKTFFILIAQKTSPLLPTIISRCSKIRFEPLSYKHIEQNLIDKFNIDRQMAHIASRTADADLEKAFMYLNLNLDDTADSIDWIQKRKYLLKALVNIILTDTSSCISKGLMLSQKICLDPDQFDNTFAIMKTFFRDLMIFRYNGEKIVNLDFSDTFKDISLKIKSTVFNEWLENLFETQKRIAANSSPRLVLDRFFLKIALGKRNLIYD